MAVDASFEHVLCSFNNFYICNYVRDRVKRQHLKVSEEIIRRARNNSD
jgi:hypothetical protein